MNSRQAAFISSSGYICIGTFQWVKISTLGFDFPVQLPQQTHKVTEAAQNGFWMSSGLAKASTGLACRICGSCSSKSSLGWVPVRWTEKASLTSGSSLPPSSFWKREEKLPWVGAELQSRVGCESQTAGHVLKRSAMLSKPWLGAFLEPQSSVCDVAAPSSSVVGAGGSLDGLSLCASGVPTV